MPIITESVAESLNFCLKEKCGETSNIVLLGVASERATVAKKLLAHSQANTCHEHKENSSVRRSSCSIAAREEHREDRDARCYAIRCESSVSNRYRTR